MLLLTSNTSRALALLSSSGVAGAWLFLLSCTPTNPLSYYTEGGSGSAGIIEANSPDSGTAGAASLGGAGGAPLDSDAGNGSSGSGGAGFGGSGFDAGLPLDGGSVRVPDATLSIPCDGTNEISNNGSCYLVVIATSNWQDAREACVIWGGQLVTINAPEEDVFVATTAQGISADMEYWIGYNDLATEGTFAWVSGAPALAQGGVELWEDAPTLQQPTDTPLENCVGRLNSGGWYDLSCTDAINYGSVCERDL